MNNHYNLLRIRWLLYFTFFFVLPLRYKAHFVNEFMIFQISISIYGALQSVLHDSIIVFQILLLVYLSLLIKNLKFIRYLLRTLALCLFFIYIIDIYIIYNFTTHITLNDVLKYGAYAGKYLYQTYGITAPIFITLLVLAVLFVIYDLDNLILKSKISHVVFCAILLMCLSAYHFRDTSRYIHSWIYDNLIEYNFSILAQSAKYSEEFKRKLSAPKENTACYKKNSKDKNIILLMVESLSSYQSHFFSGIKNWTPKFDAIAKNNISFVNFYANGFNTEDGYIATLTGLPPVSSPSVYSDFGAISFRGFDNITNSLPNMAKSFGYETYFLSSGDMMLSNEKKWADAIGFDYIEGSNHPYYKGIKKYHFNSVPDAALYGRAMTIISNMGNRSYFMFISTLSSHPPFINPENGIVSEEDVIKYVDKEIGHFYNKLKHVGFFESGVLLVTGDHRAMTPLNEAEIKKFGLIRAPARIPLVLSYGDTVKYIEKNAFQQTDIYNSIKNYISDRKCVTQWLGDFINKPITPPVYIIFKRGDERSLISVFYGRKNLLIKLNGDKTGVVHPAYVDKKIANLIVNKINYERIMRGKNVKRTK